MWIYVNLCESMWPYGNFASSCQTDSQRGFSAQFRLEAARRAVSEDSLLAVGSWEAGKHETQVLKLHLTRTKKVNSLLITVKYCQYTVYREHVAKSMNISYHVVSWISYYIIISYPCRGLKDTLHILFAISSTKSQQLSLGTWCILGPSFV